MKKGILVLSMLVALVGVLVVPMAALAVTTTDVGGTMPDVTLTLAAPSGITLGSLYGATGDATGASATPGTVLCLMNPTGYTLKINSNKTDGKMQETGSGTLAAVLRVTPTLGDGTGATVSPGSLTDVTVTTTSNQTVGTTTASSPTETGTNAITLSVKQAKQITGVPTATYSLTLTFTASANS
jgi:hypothetical protein